MDMERKRIMENFDKMKIGVDEPFKFHCIMCGRCCIHREDILLSPKDVYRMSKELKITPKEFLEQYCETYIGGDSRIPIVRLRPRGSVKRCPLLKDRKCSVHKAKPVVCAMFPIGRCLIYEQEGQSEKNASQIQYIFNEPGCGDDSETHTVREWFESFGIPLEDEFFIKWQKVVLELGQMFRTLENIVSTEAMQKLWLAAYIALYLNYDMEQEFLQQFEENAQEFLSLVSCIGFSDEG